MRSCVLKIALRLSIRAIAAIAVNNSRLHEMEMCPYLAAVDQMNQIRKGSKKYSGLHGRLC